MENKFKLWEGPTTLLTLIVLHVEKTLEQGEQRRRIEREKKAENEWLRGRKEGGEGWYTWEDLPRCCGKISEQDEKEKVQEYGSTKHDLEISSKKKDSLFVNPAFSHIFAENVLTVAKP
jgi:hypothetical protein